LRQQLPIPLDAILSVIIAVILHEQLRNKSEIAFYLSPTTSTTLAFANEQFALWYSDLLCAESKRTFQFVACKNFLIKVPMQMQEKGRKVMTQRWQQLGRLNDSINPNSQKDSITSL